MSHRITVTLMFDDNILLSCSHFAHGTSTDLSGLCPTCVGLSVFPLHFMCMCVRISFTQQVRVLYSVCKECPNALFFVLFGRNCYSIGSHTCTYIHIHSTVAPCSAAVAFLLLQISNSQTTSHRGDRAGTTRARRRMWPAVESVLLIENRKRNPVQSLATDQASLIAFLQRTLTWSVQYSSITTTYKTQNNVHIHALFPMAPRLRIVEHRLCLRLRLCLYTSRFSKKYKYRPHHRNPPFFFSI